MTETVREISEEYEEEAMEELEQEKRGKKSGGERLRVSRRRRGLNRNSTKE